MVKAGLLALRIQVLQLLRNIVSLRDIVIVLNQAVLERILFSAYFRALITQKLLVIKVVVFARHNVGHVCDVDLHELTTAASLFLQLIDVLSAVAALRIHDLGFFSGQRHLVQLLGDYLAATSVLLRRSLQGYVLGDREADHRLVPALVRCLGVLNGLVGLFGDEDVGTVESRFVRLAQVERQRPRRGERQDSSATQL